MSITLREGITFERVPFCAAAFWVLVGGGQQEAASHKANSRLCKLKVVEWNTRNTVAVQEVQLNFNVQYKYYSSIV